MVLASAHGAEINDFLMTYEILARSQAFNVYAVAPERGLITSQHGLTFVPRHDFETSPRLDRVVLPGGAAPETARRAGVAWARARWGLPLDEIHASVGAGPCRTGQAGSTPVADQRTRVTHAQLRDGSRSID